MAVRRHESTSTKLLEILKEENANLKRELETYYQRVRKLQRLEQELERIREGHRLLEVSSARKEKLEAAMRYKLEGELRRLKEANLQQRGRPLDRSSLLIDWYIHHISSLLIDW